MTAPRLLHIMDYEPRGTRTMDHFVLGFTQTMRARGWEVRYAFGADLPAEFAAALSKAGGSSVTIPFPFTKASAAELLRALGDYRPDVTQTSFLSPFTPAVRWLKTSGFTRRLVVIDHSSGLPPRRMGFLRLAAKLRGWWAGRVVDAIIPVSEAIARRNIEQVFLPAQKVKVVYNGIRLASFANPARPLRPLIRVVYAGQLMTEKGVLTLLKAHDRLRKMGLTNYELLVAGTGPQEAELKAFCQSAGHADVQFLGHIDSVPELFGSANVVVVPSEWYEAFGLVVAEAMACGAACLVSDAGALPEVVADAGRVFRAGDETDLAVKLCELIGSPETCRDLGAAGRVRVEKLFTLDRMIEGHATAAELALSGGNAHA